jgi:limonene-1,2-epoxide hydrolase
MTNNEQIIRDFIASWSSLDPDRIADFFADDGVYYNMPIAPVAGKAHVRGFIAAFIKGWTSTEWKVLNLVSAGNIVIAERVDNTIAGGKSVSLPCCGLFEMEDGKIKVWRDYFDMATYTKALAS